MDLSILVFLLCSQSFTISDRTVDEASNDVVCPPQSENQVFNSFNRLNSKQVNNSISLGYELVLQAEKKKEYMNEYSVMLFDFMKSLPLEDNLKDGLHKVVLATQVQSTSDLLKLRTCYLKLLWILKKAY